MSGLHPKSLCHGTEGEDPAEVAEREFQAGEEEQEMRIARIFPTRTSTSPTDQDVYFGGSELFMPEYDEVYISALNLIANIIGANTDHSIMRGARGFNLIINTI